MKLVAQHLNVSEIALHFPKDRSIAGHVLST